MHGPPAPHRPAASAPSPAARAADERALREAVRRRPDDVAAHTMLAQARLDQHRPHAAERSLREALRRQPDYAPAQAMLGTVLQTAGRHAEAIGILTALARAHPDDGGAHHALGVSQRAVGRLHEARDSLVAAIARAPAHTLAHAELGNVLHDLGRPSDAMQAFASALATDPALPAAHLGMGVCANILGHFARAQSHLTRALQLHPGWVEALTSRGDTWRALGLPDRAEADLREALRLRPGHADARVNLAFVLLQSGRYAEGWRLHEARWQAAAWRHRKPRVAGPLWQGEKLEGRTLLLHAEQGLGDTIQFARLASLVPGAGRVLLRVQPPLVSLLAGLPGVHDVVADDAPPPAFGVQCPLMSLPHALKLEAVPQAAPYLRADPAKAAAARQWLAGFPGLRVGLVWAGDPAMAADARRSIALQRLAPLGAVSGVSFVGLQRGAAASQPPPPGLKVHDAAGLIDDFRGTAAVIAGLDLVIGVDTAVIHLAGALGRPVWLLDRFDACWRWLSGREDSPWYPTMRIFRQPSPGAWDDVVAAAHTALQAKVTGPG